MRFGEFWFMLLAAQSCPPGFPDRHRSPGARPAGSDRPSGGTLSTQSGLGPRAFALVGLPPAAGGASRCPQFPPLFPLKDQLFMVLVLIVFIVFKSVFLYVEGK